MARLFGTDGVRGVANTELTVELAYNLGRAAAFVLIKNNKKPKIILGKDTRVSSDMLECALVAGILSVGAEAICVGEIPTPAIAYLTRKYKGDVGVVISASHNPVEYNGIKFFDRNGYKLSDSLEDEIQEIIENNLSKIPIPTGGDLGRKIIKNDAKDEYVNFLKSTIDISLKGMKVALDCANGASHGVAVKTFVDLGAEVLVINNEPNGININDNCGSTHPEGLMKFVVDNKCDVGFAFDGDADRCLAIDEEGKLIHGDYILTICGKYLKDIGSLAGNTIVITVMSNLGMVLACDKEGINTVKTKVGDRYVLEKMIEDGYIIGGEQSGHIIFLQYNTTGDGLITALQIAAIIKKTNTPLSNLASIMNELPQVLVNIKIPNKMKDICERDIDIIEKIKNIEKTLNGMGRVLIRPSGTEPLLRIMLEGKNQKEIEKMAYDLVSLIEKKLNI